MVKTNTGLQELNISYHGRDVQYCIEHVVKMWHQSSSSFRLTLFDRMQDTHGRVITELADNEDNGLIPGNRSLDICKADTEQLQNQEHAMGTFPIIEFLQWDCDHISGQLSDYSASFLDMATQQHPSALTLFKFDVSQLSRTGLASVQNILGRSSLEYLDVMCTPFNSTVSESISQVLGSIKWPTLKYLVLSGDNINMWIRHWPSPHIVPQLLCLHIQGPESSEHLPFKRPFFYANPLMELHLDHIQFEDKRDWELIVKSVDPALLKTFGLDGV
ncbi:hypothetical protein BG000_008152 [Podila horticola]|nr:hypothetical protein BG000_008152 [Podila horticola]